MDRTKTFVDDFIAILQKHGALKGKDASFIKKDFATRTDLVLEEFLVDEHLVSKEDLLRALQEYYKVPAIDVIGIFFDHHLVTMFGRELMMRHYFIPYQRDQNILSVIAAQPDDPELLDLIGQRVSYDITFMVGYFKDIRTEISEFFDRSPVEARDDEDLRIERRERAQEKELEQLTEEENIIK